MPSGDCPFKGLAICYDPECEEVISHVRKYEDDKYDEDYDVDWFEDAEIHEPPRNVKMEKFIEFTEGKNIKFNVRDPVWP